MAPPVKKLPPELLGYGIFRRPDLGTFPTPEEAWQVAKPLWEAKPKASAARRQLAAA